MWGTELLIMTGFREYRESNSEALGQRRVGKGPRFVQWRSPTLGLTHTTYVKRKKASETKRVAGHSAPERLGGSRCL